MRLKAAALAILISSALSVGALAAPTLAEAVAGLETTRTQVTTCVGVIKGRGDAAARDTAMLAYGDAKAKADALIGGMIAATTDRGDPTRFPKLNERLTAVTGAATPLCDTAKALAAKDAGDKNVWGAVIEAVLGEPLAHAIDAVKELVLQSWKDERDRLDTIRIQLEGQRWPGFEDIAAVR